MELAVLEAEGLPEHSVVSVRTGTCRRRSPNGKRAHSGPQKPCWQKPCWQIYVHGFTGMLVQVHGLHH